MAAIGEAHVEVDWLGLSGRVCVVTGGAGSIGAAIARALAGVGAAVALLDRDEAGAKAIAADIIAAGGRATSAACDVSKASSVQEAADTVAGRFGPCAVLVNNAAAIYADALMQVDARNWDQLLAVNLTGYLLCSQAFGRQMMKGGGGSLIHVGSIAGRIPQPFSGAYSVSKAGVAMLSQVLAIELGEHRIRSNVVSPAMVHTPMTASIYRDPEVVRRREEIVPAGRISTPQDVADTVVFLASDRSSYINGQELLVDGGLSQAWLGLVPRPGFEKRDAT